MNPTIFFIILVILCITVTSSTNAAFGDKPPLGPDDAIRRLLQPYDLIKLNYLGMNYCENLLDERMNITSYTHLGFNRNSGDAWHLQFPDDAARFIEGIAWEDEYSPVVRLELARRLTKGLIAAHYPGTQGYYAFRHRSAGKTFMIFDDEESSKQGRLLLSNWGDAIEGMVKVGFRMESGGKWLEINDFRYTDTPEKAGSAGVGRSPRYWNESPFVFKRHYENGNTKADFTGRYWLSDENKPLEFAFDSKDADSLQIVVGEPGKHMQLLMDGNAPGTIHLPDRRTSFTSNETGDKTFDKPDFNYFILRKTTAWASPGYSTALLVMWEGRPEKIEALKENGYGQIRFSYPAKDGKAGGKVWLYPFQWVNDKDMEYIYRNAESFLSHGKLIHNGFPSQQLVNALPAGIAAGAYLLTKYDDPSAPTARIHAENAVDALLDPEQDGMKIMRVFFTVKAAAWMVKTGKELGDQRLISKYTPLLDRTMTRLLSSEAGYDGKGWGSDWDHFNSIKAVWLAYDATGNEEYLKAYNRAVEVFTIDEKGIYREGKMLPEPGGFSTYCGSLPLGTWGHAGKLDWVDKLINLDVPAGWQNGSRTMKDTWNDTGAGPWAQDDANPEYVGFCLRGANIPQTKKYVLPVGAFPVYDGKGSVEITNQPIMENPFFPKGNDLLKVMKAGERTTHKVSAVTVVPADEAETKHLVRNAGSVENGQRTCTGKGMPLIYRFDSNEANGTAVDLLIEGDGYQVEVSPDGKRWYKRLDTWSNNFKWQSLDVSFLTGGRDEMLKILEITPPEDADFLLEGKESTVEREHCRSIVGTNSFTYRLELPDMLECHLELLLGNNYKVECSSDGKKWQPGTDVQDHINNNQPDSAWIKMLDVTKYIKDGNAVYLRFSCFDDEKAADTRTAFLRRLTAYGVMKSSSVYVKLSNVSQDNAFHLQRLVFRKW